MAADAVDYADSLGLNESRTDSAIDVAVERSSAIVAAANHSLAASPIYS